MRLFKYLLPIFMAISLTTTASILAQHAHGGGHGHEGGHESNHHEELHLGGQDRSRYSQEINERDWNALRDFLKSKRESEIEKEGSDCGLTISGDVRTEWRHLTESGINLNGDYASLRGGTALKKKIPISRNDFDIEANLRFDYICERSWAVLQLGYDNAAGVDDNEHPCKCVEDKNGKCSGCDPQGYHGSGSCDGLCLKKAYFGVNVYKCHDARIDIELGRRNLYNVFDSQIEFLSRFDGILFKYSNSFCKTDYYWNTAAFVVDERVNHFAWVTEIGFLDINDYHFDLKYSFIDWKKNGRNRCEARNPRGFNFLVSQWTTAYHIDKKVYGMPVKLYAAYLRNHSNVNIELPVDSTDSCEKNKRKIKGQPNGWYAGFTAGEVRKEGDYAFTLQYEWVGATAMPDNDACGIGTGNVLNNSFTENGRSGNTNYKGLKIEFLYALTDNLSLDSILEFSKQIKKSIGGRHNYSKFELEAIYAF